MNFTKLTSLFAFVTLAVLSLGFASAQTSSCITLQSSSFPNSVVNTQSSFTATFILNNTGIGCAVARNVTGVIFISTLNGNNAGVSWALNTNLPATIAVGQLSSFTATFNVSAGSFGTLINSISVSTTTQAGSQDPNSPYIFPLPSVTITQPS